MLVAGCGRLALWKPDEQKKLPIHQQMLLEAQNECGKRSWINIAWKECDVAPRWSTLCSWLWTASVRNYKEQKLGLNLKERRQRILHWFDLDLRCVIGRDRDLDQSHTSGPDPTNDKYRSAALQLHASVYTCCRPT